MRECAEIVHAQMRRETTSVVQVGLTREITWEVTNGFYLHFGLQYPFDVAFVFASGPEQESVNDLAGIVQRYLEPLGDAKLLGEFDAAASGRERLVRLVRLGIGAPLEVDERYFRRIVAAMHDPDDLVRMGALWSALYASWPEFLPEVDAIAENDEDESLREQGRVNTTPKIVISRTLTYATWAGTQVISAHPEEVLAQLKQQAGKNIVVPGSSTLTASLLQTGLLDELRIMVNPVILGQGRSLFAGAAKTNLTLLKTQQFASGNILLYYRPVTN